MYHALCIYNKDTQLQQSPTEVGSNQEAFVPFIPHIFLQISGSCPNNLTICSDPYNLGRA